MAITYRAIGLSTSPAPNGQFTARVRFVQLEDGPPPVTRELSEQAFTVADEAALAVVVQAQLDSLASAQADADRAINMAGKTLAEVTIP